MARGAFVGFKRFLENVDEQKRKLNEERNRTNEARSDRAKETVDC